MYVKDLKGYRNSHRNENLEQIFSPTFNSLSASSICDKLVTMSEEQILFRSSL